jgi:hypothetical protein
MQQQLPQKPALHQTQASLACAHQGAARVAAAPGAAACKWLGAYAAVGSPSL